MSFTPVLEMREQCRQSAELCVRSTVESTWARLLRELVVCMSCAFRRVCGVTAVHLGSCVDVLVLFSETQHNCVGG